MAEEMLPGSFDSPSLVPRSGSLRIAQIEGLFIFASTRRGRHTLMIAQVRAVPACFIL